MIRVVLLGAGNVATHLYKAFKNAKTIEVTQWYNRSYSSISSYANEVETIDKINQLKEADIYILAVSDDSISELSRQLPFKNRVIAHTSGSVSMHDLDKKNEIAVFYPLQTFSKDADIDFTEVPICIESYQKANLDLLQRLAGGMGCKAHKIITTQRQKLHLAAVFVNNFVNQLYRVGHEICESERIEFQLLKPLISETANKILELSPYRAQTGPAKRNDNKTIKRHLKQLENEEHKAIYQLLSDSIKKTHGISMRQTFQKKQKS